MLHYKRGLPFAYPTEAVFGFGCNPWSATAVQRVFDIKGRPRRKGLIICAASIDQIEPFLTALKPQERQVLEATWPAAHTFVVPLPSNQPWWWLTPQGNTLVLRVSAHPVVRDICTLLGPVVSTGANFSGVPAARYAWQVRRHFPDLGCVVGGAVGESGRPTRITDLRTGRVLRR